MVSVVAMLLKRVSLAINRDGTAEDVRKSADDSLEIEQCGRVGERVGLARVNTNVDDWNKG